MIVLSRIHTADVVSRLICFPSYSNWPFMVPLDNHELPGMFQLYWAQLLNTIQTDVRVNQALSDTRRSNQIKLDN